MEVIVSPQGHKQNLHAFVCKTSSSNLHKDLWIMVRKGSLADVDLTLALLKKNGGNINSRNSFGLTPLHIATWRNHIPIVRRLLAAGADPNIRDDESGWSSLHRALHFGHVAVASVLLQYGASITLEDSKCRTPVDLLSGPLSRVLESDNSSVVTEVFSWGSGTNYQLGTGNEHIQKLPCKVDALHGNVIKLISASKFHSVAVSACGRVYTWGFGRGGRLGHPEFDIHGGQAAVITPRQVTFGLGNCRVKAVAAAKHHTVIATEGGDVFTWGSNREGQLGYTSVDTQPTPRRVSFLKSKIVAVAVAAANKHTAVVSEGGEIFTWGCNKEGQLGYGTSNSASNYTPRVVEYLKGKNFVGIAAAKRHTVVLGNDGEVYTWGHRLVNPRRVVIARNLKKSGTSPLKFHRMKRLHVVSVAAGMVYSLALTDDGALFYWISSDPDLRCHQQYTLCGRNIVNISAGKYWTSAVTSTGDVYMWDGKTDREKPPVVARVHGIKKATSVSVGETHLLIIGSLHHPVYPCNQTKVPQQLVVAEELDEFTEDLMFNDRDSDDMNPLKNDNEPSPIPSLKSLCEKVAAKSLVEPRNAIQLLEIADSLGADDLRKHCQDIAIRNIDYIFTVASQSVASASLDILANLETSLDLRSSEPWSHRQLPTPTATFPAVIYSEEEGSESEIVMTRKNHTFAVIINEEGQRPDSFLQPKVDHHEATSKQVRALRKKLQQIAMLEAKQARGQVLDDQQISKLQSKLRFETSLIELGISADTLHENPSSFCSDGKGIKSSEQWKKHGRKSKQKGEQKTSFGVAKNEVEPPTKNISNVGFWSVSKHKEEDTVTVGNTADETKTKASVPATSKKKNRKGGLSLFLSGALDDAPKVIDPPQPPTLKLEGPAWGGAKISKGSSSLREIQVEQSEKLKNQTSCSKDQVESQSQLSTFLLSKPIPMTSTHTLRKTDEKKNTPPWAASGTPPQLSRPSLRDIQMQQGKNSCSPKTRTAGFSVLTGQGSPSEYAAVNRWFKPEVDTPSSIRSIQIEEKAMKDLRRFYNSVQIVKNQT